jgi:hypothetical protein
VRQRATPGERRAIGEALLGAPVVPPDEVSVMREVALVASRLSAAGAEHTVLGRWPLVGSAPA